MITPDPNHPPEKDFNKDQATFDKHPEKTKQLEKLKDAEEKASGPEKADLHKQIDKKS